VAHSLHGCSFAHRISARKWSCFTERRWNSHLSALSATRTHASKASQLSAGDLESRRTAACVSWRFTRRGNPRHQHRLGVGGRPTEPMDVVDWLSHTIAHPMPAGHGFLPLRCWRLVPLWVARCAHRLHTLAASPARRIVGYKRSSGLWRSACALLLRATPMLMDTFIFKPEASAKYGARWPPPFVCGAERRADVYS